MDLYYNNTAADGDLENLANWWEDAGFTVPASALPDAGDNVTVDGDISQGALTCDSFVQINGTISGGTIVSVAGTVTPFQVSGGELTGNFDFAGATISGSPVFNCVSANFQDSGCIIADTPTFNGLAGGGTFSLNNVSVSGSPAFIGEPHASPYNLAIVGGTFGGSAAGNMNVNVTSGDPCNGMSVDFSAAREVTVESGATLTYDGDLPDLIVNVGGAVGTPLGITCEGTATIQGSMNAGEFTFNGPVTIASDITIDISTTLHFNDLATINTWAAGIPNTILGGLIGTTGRIDFGGLITLYTATSDGVAGPEDVRAGVSNLGVAGELVASGGGPLRMGR